MIEVITMLMHLKVPTLSNRPSDIKTVEIRVEIGQTLESVTREFAGEAPYTIILGRVNGVDRSLTYRLRRSDREGIIELLDLRTHSAALTYQRSLCLIYLKAVCDTYEEMGIVGASAAIENSLDKGFFTKPILRPNIEGTLDEPDDEVVEKISRKMREIINSDEKIVPESLSREEGMEFWEKFGYMEKVELLDSVYSVDFPYQIFTIGDYGNYFFGPMVPSTGYIERFELRKYRDGILLRFPYSTAPNTLPPFNDDFRVYEAFGREKKWLELLKAPFLSDMNKIVSEGKAKDLVLLSEALHEKKIAEIANEIVQKKKRIVLLAGPSSSGKTTTAKRLCVQLRVNGMDPLYMGTDDYFVERSETPIDENGDYDFENLNALDINLFNNNMNDLLAGKEVDLPEFDFIEGTKIFGKRITKISDDQLIVIEGIHALNGKLTEQIPEEEKYRIYISPLTQLNIDTHNRISSTDGRMLRRMVRDYKFRGRNAATTIDEWPNVRAGEDKNIFPFNGEADVLFNSTLPYELMVLKKYAVPLLEAIRPGEKQYSEAIRLLEFLKFVRVIDEEKFVPNNSILREFIGGSVFVE